MRALLRGVKRSLLRPISFPQYVAVGLTAPQTLVAVTLELTDGRRLDVTRNHVIVALRPLTIGVMREPASPVESNPGQRLEFVFTNGGQPLATIDLRQERVLDVEGHPFELFTVRGSTNRCLAAPVMAAYVRYEQMRTARYQRENPYNFQIESRDLQALFAFYCCPRPVVLVSVRHESASSVFPMDLIGPTDSPWFSLALRLTSAAIPLMVASGRLALSSIPVSSKQAAYELGKHHRALPADPDLLPFDATASAVFGLTVPKDALGVREVEIVHQQNVGSHKLFLTKIVNDSRRARPESAPGDAFHHIHGAFRQFLKARGCAVVEA